MCPVCCPDTTFACRFLNYSGDLRKSWDVFIWKNCPMSKVLRTKLIIYSVPPEFYLKPINICAFLWIKQFKVNTHIYLYKHIKSARVSRHEKLFPGNIMELLRRRDWKIASKIEVPECKAWSVDLNNCISMWVFSVIVHVSSLLQWQ